LSEPIAEFFVMATELFDLAGCRVYVAGHRGMVGSALVRRLATVDCEIVTASRGELDLLDGKAVSRFLAEVKPDVVIVAAAKVGGIHANNTYPAEFIYQNLAISLNIVHASYEAGVRKLLYLGSSCIYPRMAQQPIVEDELLAGPLEPTNQWYSVAKIAGIKLCQAYRRQYGADFISVMPTNLFGLGDNYHPEDSHVVAALLRRFHEAKMVDAPRVVVWGTGRPRREFLYVDDLADACVFVLDHYSGELQLNVGAGVDTTIAEFAQLVAEVVGYAGEITFDPSRPDGTPRKLLDVSKLKALGWTAKTPLQAGLAAAYADFLSGGGRERLDDGLYGRG
jgi:GDP-L-fucose synthase